MVNGLFVDFWSFGHIFVAFLYAGIFFFGTKNFWLSLGSVLFLNVMWELWEIFLKIPEGLTNLIFDIVIGISAFVIFWIFFSKYEKKIKKIRLTFHDKFLDIWSISHFFSGVIGAILLLNFRVNIYFSILLTFFFAILWEISEKIRKVGESKLNQLGDIITCLSGFSLICFLKLFFLIELKISLLIISILIIIFIKIVAHKK